MERNISVWLPLEHPQLGTWPATQAYALTGNRTGNLWFTGLNPLRHTSQGSLSPFHLIFFWSFDLFFHLGRVFLSPYFGSVPVFVSMY